MDSWLKQLIVWLYYNDSEPCQIQNVFYHGDQCRLTHLHQWFFFHENHRIQNYCICELFYSGGLNTQLKYWCRILTHFVGRAGPELMQTTRRNKHIINPFHNWHRTTFFLQSKWDLISHLPPPHTHLTAITNITMSNTSHYIITL